MIIFLFAILYVHLGFYFYLDSRQNRVIKGKTVRMACNKSPWLSRDNVKFKLKLFPIHMAAHVSLKECFSTCVYFNLDLCVQGHQIFY